MSNKLQSLYTFHLRYLNVSYDEKLKVAVVSGFISLRSKSVPESEKAFEFLRVYDPILGERSNKTDKEWKIVLINDSSTHIGRAIRKKITECLDRIVGEFGQLIIANDNFDKQYESLGLDREDTTSQSKLVLN